MGRHRAIRSPDLGACIGGLLVRPLHGAVGPAYGFLQRHVAAREDVQPPLAHQQIGLGRPQPDAFQRRQGGDGGFVVQTGEMLQIDLAGDLGPRDTLTIGRLLPRQAHAAQLIQVVRQQQLGRDPAHALAQPRPDRGGRGHRNLLLHDHAKQPFEPADPQPPFEGRRLRMHPRHGRISGDQRLARGGDVLGRGLRRHGLPMTCSGAQGNGGAGGFRLATARCNNYYLSVD